MLIRCAWDIPWVLRLLAISAWASCSFHSTLELAFSFLLATQAQIKPAQGSFSRGEAILRTKLAKKRFFSPELEIWISFSSNIYGKDQMKLSEIKGTVVKAVLWLVFSVFRMCPWACREQQVGSKNTIQQHSFITLGPFGQPWCSRQANGIVVAVCTIWRGEHLMLLWSEVESTHRSNLGFELCRVESCCLSAVYHWGSLYTPAHSGHISNVSATGLLFQRRQKIYFELRKL